METTFEIAKSYDMMTCLLRDESKETLENLYKSIELRLKQWISGIPHEKRILYRERIQRPIDYIENREFTIESVWISSNEITIVFCDPTADPDTIQLRLILTPKRILVQDIELGKKEIAFPFVWV
jgi:hypothetical protein